MKAPINLQPRHTQVLDLNQPLENILAEMKPKGRYNIRLAGKKGVTVKQIPFSQIENFYKIYQHTFVRDKFEGKDLEFFLDYAKYCQEFSRIYIASVDNQVLAGAIVVYFGNRATYFYGASSNEKREFMAPYAMHWQIIEDAKNEGYEEYDFGAFAR